MAVVRNGTRDPVAPKPLLPAKSLWKECEGHSFWGCNVPIPAAGCRFFTLDTGRPACMVSFLLSKIVF